MLLVFIIVIVAFILYFLPQIGTFLKEILKEVEDARTKTGKVQNSDKK
jgi:predicted PurR-regulated permease PerM